MNVARLIMICGIVFLHVPPDRLLVDVHNTPFELFVAFIAHGVFRATTPFLAFISGYLCFLRGPDLGPLRVHLRKKFYSLFVPLVLWNFPFVVLVYLMQRDGLMSAVISSRLYPGSLWIFVNHTLGLTGSPVIGEFNFIRDLLVTQLLAPIFALFLKRAPWLGLLAVATIFLLDLDGPLILRGVIPVVFYMGGLASTLNLDMRALDRFRVQALVIFLAFCASLVVLRLENRTYLALATPALLWPVMSYFESSRLAGWACRHRDTAFIIFAAHGPLLSVAWYVYERRLGGELFAPYPLFWFTVPTTAILAIMLGYSVLSHISEPLAKLLSGTRVKHWEN